MTPIADFHFYLLFVVVFGIGLYTMLADSNLIKKLIGLNLVQASVFLVFITAGAVAGGSSPLLIHDPPHANPLPHAIVLTAIVIGVAITAVGLALVVRLYDEFGTVDIHRIEEALAEDD